MDFRRKYILIFWGKKTVPPLKFPKKLKNFKKKSRKNKKN